MRVRMVKITFLVLLLLIILTSPLSARVIASQTIKLYGYISEYTLLDFDELGNLIFNSNNPKACLEIYPVDCQTLLCVTMP